MINLLEPVLGLLYPLSCRRCGGEVGQGGPFFCDVCLRDAAVIAAPFCTTCGRPFSGGAGGSHDCWECMKKRPPYALARAPLAYTGLIKDAIHLYKYRPVRSLKDYIGGIVGEAAAAWFREAEVAVPVPLHRKRLIHRGFNQSLFLAESAARAVGARLSVDGLVRTRHTRPQVDLGHEEREKNVKGAFSAARPSDFIGRRVLLVDDVYTTGATVKECSKVLKKAGAVEVFVLTAARVV